MTLRTPEQALELRAEWTSAGLFNSSARLQQTTETNRRSQFRPAFRTGCHLSISGLAQTIPRTARSPKINTEWPAGAWAGDAIPVCPEMN